MAATTTYRAVQVAASGELELVDRPLRDPAGSQVRIRVEACGICHTDAVGVRPHAQGEPGVVPGHEVVGRIDAVGESVQGWSTGDRVGVGYLAGHCGTCDACRHGDFVRCANQQLTGIDVDGGYAEYMLAEQTALVAIPEALSPVVAAPLLCAGLTIYNAILNSGTAPGSAVGIQGIGGLGHLGVQYAHAMGMTTVAIARGPEKEEFALELGADEYVDAADNEAAVAALKGRGGLDVIVATAASGAASSALIDGLATNGQLVVVGASPDPVTVPTADLIARGIRLQGSLTGSPVENEENLAFAVRHGIEAMVEESSLEDAPAAFTRMMDGKARFRMVLALRP